MRIELTRFEEQHLIHEETFLIIAYNYIESG